MRPTRINITKFFTQPSVANIAISVVVGALLFNAQLIMHNSQLVENVDTLFMKHFVMWSLPMIWSQILGFVAMTGIMVWMMLLCNQLQIIPVRSSMPLTVGLVMAGCMGYIQPFDESYIAIVFFIFALKELIQMYNFETQMAAGFNIVLWLSLAFLFEPEYIWLSLLFILGMIIFRVISRRVFLSIFFAIATIIFIIGSMFWLFDSLNIIIEYLDNTISISPQKITSLNKFDIAIFTFTAMMVIFSSISYFLSASNYKLNTRLNFSLIHAGFWFSLVWIILFFSSFSQLIAVPILFAIMCISLYFSTVQSKVANIMFVVWFVCFVAYRIITFYVE
jgi:hypothetical protein